jgi:hypothetical protein
MPRNVSGVTAEPMETPERISAANRKMVPIDVDLPDTLNSATAAIEPDITPPGTSSKRKRNAPAIPTPIVVNWPENLGSLAKKAVVRAML